MAAHLEIATAGWKAESWVAQTAARLGWMLAGQKVGLLAVEWADNLAGMKAEPMAENLVTTRVVRKVVSSAEWRVAKLVWTWAARKVGLLGVERVGNSVGMKAGSRVVKLESAKAVRTAASSVDS